MGDFPGANTGIFYTIWAIFLLNIWKKGRGEKRQLSLTSNPQHKPELS
jgi:hypothetical protein